MSTVAVAQQWARARSTASSGNGKGVVNKIYIDGKRWSYVPFAMISLENEHEFAVELYQFTVFLNGIAYRLWRGSINNTTI